MPQFDFYSFSSQVFWSLSGFFVFYFLFLRTYVCSISEALKFRTKLLSLKQDSNEQKASKSTYDKMVLSVFSN